MQAYVNQPEQTQRAISEDGWYLNLGDIGFYLQHEDGDGRDIYW